MKKTWQTLNHILGRNKSSKPPSHFIDSDGSEIKDPVQIGNKLNDFFTNIGPSLAAKIPPPNITKFSNPNSLNHSIFLSPTTEEEVLDISSSLKSSTSCGVDVSKIQFAAEKYYVAEGQTLEVRLIRTGVLSTTADLVGVVDLVTGSSDLSLLEGTYTFADETITTVQQVLLMATSDGLDEDVECYEIALQAIAPTGGTTAAEVLGDISTAEVCISDAPVSKIQFADEKYSVAEGQTLEVRLIRTGVLSTTADLVGVVDLVTGSSDLSLLEGTYTFADETITTVQQVLLMATSDGLDEDVECYEIALQAIAPTGGTTAAEVLGDISTAEVCISDAPVSKIQFADEKYSVAEGQTLEVRLIRTGVLSTTADLVGVVDLVTGSSDLSLMEGTYTFADETITTVQQTLLMATSDGLDEDVECYEIALQAIAPTGGTTAAEVLGDISTAEVCISDAPVSKIQFADEKYSVAEGQTLEVRLIRTGVLSTTADLVGVVDLVTGSSDISLMEATYTFADETVTTVQQALLMATTDGLDEDVECYEIALQAISPTGGTTAVEELGDISTAEVCISDAPVSKIQFADEKYSVAEGQTLEVRLIRTGVLSTTADLVGVVDLVTGSSDLSLMEGTYTFADETITTVQQALLMATTDGLDEDVECYEIALQAISPTGGTTAAESLGDISTAEVCVLDAKECVPECENGGVCIANNLCTCLPGFAGATCENTIAIANSISLMSNVYTVIESVGNFKIFLQRHGDISTSLNIGLSIIEESATLSEDFTFTSPAEITFQPGQSTARFQFTITDDQELEAHEFFRVVIDSGTSGSSIEGDGEARVYIWDDDEDLVPEFVNCPADQTWLPELGSISAQVSWPAPQVLDDHEVDEGLVMLEITPEVIGLSLSPLEGIDINLDIGVYAVSYSYTDAEQQEGICTFNVTVQGPSAPSNLQCSSISSTSLRFTWSAPSSSSFDNYLVTYTPSNGSPASPISVQPSDSRDVTLTNLLPNTNYNISIVTVAGQGVSSVMSDPLERSCQTRPSTPSNLQCSSISSTSLRFTWSAPSSSFDNYLVTYTPNNGSPASPIFVQPSDSRDITLTNLLPNTNYNISIVTVVDQGAARILSDPLERSCQTRPSTPSNLQCSSTSSTSLRFTWSAPISSFDNYLVTYTPSNGSPDSPISVQPSDSRDITLINLLPNTNYNISIVTVAGQGAASVLSDPLERSCQTRPDAPSNLQCSSISSTSFRFTWSAPSSSFDNYLVTYTPSNGSPASPIFVQPSDSRDITLTNLLPNTNYNISIVTVADQGSTSVLLILSDSLERFCQTSLAQPGDIIIQDITENCVTFTWGEINLTFDNYLIQVFDEELNTDVDNQIRQNVDTIMSCALTPGKLYTIVLETSPTISVSGRKSFITKLNPAQNIQCSGSTATSVTVTWHAPASSGGFAAIFDVYKIYTRQSAGQRNLVATIPNDDSTLQYEIMGLLSSSDYNVTIDTCSTENDPNGAGQITSTSSSPPPSAACSTSGNVHIIVVAASDSKLLVIKCW
ncbi:uncharacterized protein [Amphiura filiformis]|uniref:uncharacterized protein n=1 Tax=Amphiura filiformis TaxID=82378 RepID=UPI003B21B8DE